MITQKNSNKKVKGEKGGQNSGDALHVHVESTHGIAVQKNSTSCNASHLSPFPNQWERVRQVLPQRLTLLEAALHTPVFSYDLLDDLAHMASTTMLIFIGQFGYRPSGHKEVVPFGRARQRGRITVNDAIDVGAGKFTEHRSDVAGVDRHLASNGNFNGHRDTTGNL